MSLNTGTGGRAQRVPGERQRGRAAAEGIESPPAREQNHRAMAATALTALYLVVVVRTAWIGDDAFITFRTVDNFVHGYGIRWNVVERVQSFTHPLWFFVLSLSYSITREIYFTAYVLTIAISAAAFALVLRRVASTTTAACVAGVALVCSKAFVDYSTSGLENPLSHLLVVLFLLAYWRWSEERRGLTQVFMLAGLLAVNRLDLALVAAPPAMAAASAAGWRRTLRPAAIGLAPLVAWELFSVVYFGVPFPNTAYAKLETGIPSMALAGQGLLYLLDAIGTDPVTPLAIAAGGALVWQSGLREDRPILLGVLLYLAYVVRVGGDFMTGRFLSVPFLMIVATWARLPRGMPVGGAMPAVACLLTLGLFSTTRPPLTSGAGTFILNALDGVTPSGVADERAFYYRYTGLLRWSRERPLPWNAQVERGLALRNRPDVISETNVGLIGFYAGPEVTIIDEYGLCDPLLARLPVEGDWRIGHFHRLLPPGYARSVRENLNLIEDPRLAMQYEQIRRVTRDPLWTRRRWRAIVALNLGG